MAKLKARKQTKGKPSKRGFPWFLWLAIALVIAGIAAFVYMYPTNQPPPNNLGEPKAAIIDQLYNLQPNQAFIDEATAVLEGYGFNVDLYQGDEVTVDFFRKLPSYGYKLILFRVHSGELIREHDSQLVEATFLFTSEPYSQTKYIGEQMSGQMAMARASEHHPYVFAIGANFVTSSMKGNFDNTVIIMMGCSAIRHPDMAQAFIKKGASTYLGWGASVDLSYVDGAALVLISNLCTKAMTVEQAIVSTMNEVGPDPTYGAYLHCYPEQSAKHTIAELM